MQISEELWDGFPALQHKSEEGLHTLKDFLSFLKKRAFAEEEYSKLLFKNVKSAMGEKRLMFQSENVEFESLVTCWKQIVDSTKEVAERHESIALDINERMVEPLTTFLKEHEKKQKSIVSEGERLTKELQNQYAQLEKSKQAYIKASQEAVLAADALNAMNKDSSVKPKELQKAQSKASITAEKAQQSDMEYKARLDAANLLQKIFLTDSMPSTLDALQEWDKVRLHMLKQYLRKLLYCYTGMPELMAKHNSLNDSAVAAIDLEKDIRAFIDQHKSYRDPPSAIEYEPFDAEDFRGQHKTKSGAMARMGRFVRSKTTLLKKSHGSANAATASEAASPHAVFGATLARALAIAPSDTEPDLPKIVTMLTDWLIHDPHLATEGLFRVPGEQALVHEIKTCVNTRGDYDIITECAETHVVAAALKLYLRTLEEPLIPAELYDRAVACQGSEDALTIYNDLPKQNQHLVRHIASLLTALTHPDIVEKTKMHLDNLSMVFAPSFLRCPSSDPTVILSSANPEKKFVFHITSALVANGITTPISLACLNQTPPLPPPKLQPPALPPARVPAPLPPTAAPPAKEPLAEASEEDIIMGLLQMSEADEAVYEPKLPADPAPEEEPMQEEPPCGAETAPAALAVCTSVDAQGEGVGGEEEEEEEEEEFTTPEGLPTPVPAMATEDPVDDAQAEMLKMLEDEGTMLYSC